MTLIKLSPHSFATALASMVLPHPGGPNSSIPDVSLRGRLLNNSGYFIGHSSVSHRVDFTVSNPPTLSQLTVDV